METHASLKQILWKKLQPTHCTIANDDKTGFDRFHLVPTTPRRQTEYSLSVYGARVPGSRKAHRWLPACLHCMSSVGRSQSVGSGRTFWEPDRPIPRLLLADTWPRESPHPPSLSFLVWKWAQWQFPPPREDTGRQESASPAYSMLGPAQGSPWQRPSITVPHVLTLTS